MHLDELRDHCLGLPEVTEDMPFGPDVLVFRFQGKMFALVSLDGESVNLKCDPERALELRDEHPDLITPGYHMNKRHWNTVALRGRLPTELVRDLVNHSYALVSARKSKPKS